MTYCPQPLRVTQGPCGAFARVIVERDMGFLGARLLCTVGHSRAIAIYGVATTPERPVVKRAWKAKSPTGPACALGGCTNVAKPGRRFCSRKHAGLATSPATKVWPAARREAFIADYEAAVPVSIMVKRYGLSSWRRVAERAGQFRRQGYAVKYRTKVA